MCNPPCCVLRMSTGQTEKAYDMLGTGSFAVLALGSLLTSSSMHARKVSSTVLQQWWHQLRSVSEEHAVAVAWQLHWAVGFQLSYALVVGHTRLPPCCQQLAGRALCPDNIPVTVQAKSPAVPACLSACRADCRDRLCCGVGCAPRRVPCGARVEDGP